MTNPNLWTRRKFSKAALAAQALLSTGLLSVTACRSDSTPGILPDSTLKNILTKALDAIIPKGDTMPAASNLRGVDYIYGILEDYPDLKDPFQQILRDLDQLARDNVGQAFMELNPEQITELLKNYESAQSQSFGVLKNFVYESYYTNPQVWELIGYEPYPTLSAGPKMDPFDPALLERVKDLPPFYIDPDAPGES